MWIIERLTGHYDVQEMPFGRAYRWSPEQVAVKCRCSKNVTYKRLGIIDSKVISCECGKTATLAGRS